jgi:tRNA(fMet)-specific endonuclease VapC
MIRGLKKVAQEPPQPETYQHALRLVERCRQAQREAHSVGLSAISVSELEFGARKSGRYEAEMEAVRKILMPFDIYDYDGVSCAYHYGNVRHQLESKGQPIGAMDLFIAAHALSLDATLVTNNESHFSRIEGLKLAYWSVPES